ncbi:MAG: N-acetylmuramic acid 6-phosphate etherase [Phycisphaerales bacterium]
MSGTNPTDRSHLPTEGRNARSMNLHRLSVDECVRLIADEDRAAPAAVERAAAAITGFISAALPGFAAGGRLIYLGAGTSGRLGVLDASECPPTFCVPPDRVIGLIAGGDAALRRSSEGKEDDHAGAHAELASLSLSARDTVVGIAAGGTTPYVLGGLAYAAAQRDAPTGARRSPVTGLLTCVPIDPAAVPTVKHLIVLETGPEVLTGSTRMKAGSATKMALNIISTTLMIQCGKVHENLMVDVRATNQKLRDRAARIIATLTGLGRDEALTLLDRAGGHVKTAVVMHARRVGADAARQLILAADGRLDRAIDARSPT